MTAITLAPSTPALSAPPERLQLHRRFGVAVVARRSGTAVVAAFAVATVWMHRHQLGAGFHILNHLSWWWLPAALVLEVASLASYAVLQSRLVRAGNINISAFDMTKILMAANAISASLPGGAAWSATWSWKQLRNHGADRRLATWVVLAAGALSSFALFVIALAGTELAGDHGPVASLRWLACVLAGVAVAGGVLLAIRAGLAIRTGRAIRAGLGIRTGRSGAGHSGAGDSRAQRSRRSPSGSRLVRLYDRTRVVRLSPRGWAASLILALANWLLDMACLIACIAAVGADIHWRGVVVVYALTQLIALLPFTPGGLGVVEAGLTALLVRYGTPAPSAIATVVLYRALTFWVVVPAGWVVWWRLDKGRPTLGAPGYPGRRNAQALLANGGA
jgi:uncharacterized membrane protein YbhN (UPF0104 family)